MDGRMDGCARRFRVLIDRLIDHAAKRQQAKEAVQQRMWTRVLEHFVVLPIEADVPLKVDRKLYMYIWMEQGRDG